MLIMLVAGSRMAIKHSHRIGTLLAHRFQLGCGRCALHLNKKNFSVGNK